ncbi:Canalicular multispecific organic anion transporter 1 [Salvia divinorum]|uniref:Canalicular multispecific organic anion transporter 1 n=1 Tax=Salvia divinorum TaxID=28513 RepID=A0ABD1I5C5_SALDI
MRAIPSTVNVLGYILSAKRFWRVAAPYWLSDDKAAARWRLANIFALTLGTSAISIGFNFLGRDFFNTLADKDQERFTKQLVYYPVAFAGGILFHNAVTLYLLIDFLKSNTKVVNAATKSLEKRKQECGGK